MAIQKLFFENFKPKFISVEAKKQFIDYIKDMKAGTAGGPGRDPNVKTLAKLGELMGVKMSSVERATRYLKKTGELPKTLDYPEITKTYVERFVPEAQNSDGSFNAEKYKKLSESQKQKIKSNRRTLQDFLDDPSTKTRGNEIKKFVDEYRKLREVGKESRLFLGTNIDQRELPLTEKQISRRTGSGLKLRDFLNELWKSGDYNTNPKNASALQMGEGFNSVENKAYLKDLKEIKNKYLDGDRGGLVADITFKDRDKFYKQYMDDVYRKELPEFYKSKEFKNADNIDDILKIIKKRFSDPVLYPGSVKGKSLDLFEKASTHDFRARNLGTRKLPGSKLAYQPSGTNLYNEIVANYLKTPKGKKAIALLDEYVELNKEFSKLKPGDVDSWEKYNKLASQVRKLKFESPQLDIFLKPLSRLGIVKVYEDGRQVPIEELESRELKTSAKPTIDNLNKFYKEQGTSNPLKLSTINFFAKKQYERTASDKYNAAYDAGLNKVLKGSQFKNPQAYKNAVLNLSRVLTLQLGGLGITGEHRVGVKMLDNLNNPEYVAKMVLSPSKFNALKGASVEKTLTPIFNNPRVSAEAKKAAAEREYAKFFKKFGVTPEMQKTYPKFEVTGNVLKETQIDKELGKFGLEKGMGNLKKTIKNILTEQALTDRVLQSRNQYKPLADRSIPSWMKTGRFGKMGIQNTDKVQQILNILNKQGVGSSKADQLISELVEGEFTKVVNEESMAQFGRQFCADGCLAKSVKKDPGLVERALNKMASTLPRLGTVGKIGTVAAGAGIALSGLRYNPEKGEIVTTDNDQKADQNQILQYVKDNPLKVTAGTSIGFAAQEVPGAYKAARDLGRGRVRSTLGISGAIRPILTTFGTPLMTGLYEGAIGSKRLEEGETMTDILTDPVGPALGLALMEPLSKLSGVVRDAPKRTMLEGAKNYFNLSNVGQARPGLTGQILRMGLSPRMIAGASRFLGLPGIAIGAGLAGYDAYKNYQNQEGMIYNLFNKDE